MTAINKLYIFYDPYILENVILNTITETQNLILMSKKSLTKAVNLIKNTVKC